MWVGHAQYLRKIGAQACFSVSTRVAPQNHLNISWIHARALIFHMHFAYRTHFVQVNDHFVQVGVRPATSSFPSPSGL